MKKFEKRVISVALIIALVATTVTLSPKLRDASVTHAAPKKTIGNAVRGEVTSLGELPQYGKDNWQSLQRGTTDRPFVVLELVPDKSIAEIGYMIGGCEPVDIDRLLLNGTAMSKIENMGFLDLSSKHNNGTLFLDEILYMCRNDDTVLNDLKDSTKREAMLQKLTGQSSSTTGGTSAAKITSSQTVYGYFEKVADGTGYFNITVEEDVSGNSSTTSSKSPVKIMEVPGTKESAPAGNTDPADESEESSGSSEPSESQESSESGGDTSTAYIGGSLVLTSEVGDGTSDGNEGDDSSASGGNEGGSNSTTSENEEGGNNNGWSLLGLTPPELLGYKVKVEYVAEGTGGWRWVTAGNKDDGNTYETITIGTETTLKVDPRATGRLYTTRSAVSTSGDVAEAYTMNGDYYTEYKNNELFLKNSMSIGEDKVADYSVVVKTITPDELKTTPDWIEYADLVYMNCTNHRGGTDGFIDQYYAVWGDSSGTPAAKKSFAENDLDFPTALKLYKKVTRLSNYAGIMIEENVYKSSNATGGSGRELSAVNGANTTKVNIKLYDWNFDEYRNNWGNEITEFHNIDGCNNNIYKLCVMLLCMDPNLFSKTYLNENHPLINDKGEYLMQEGDARTYWNTRTFMLVPPNTDVYSNNGNSYYQYFNSNDAFASYQFCTGPESISRWVQGHVLSFGANDMTTAGAFLGELQNSEKFTDFHEFCAADGNHAQTVAEAVKYILNAADSGPYGENLTINVLDIEPSVGLDKDSNPDWMVTENYIQWLIPSFAGKINITHQTTAQFIGMAEDLNAEYQMIFMGLDVGGYNTRRKTVGNRQIDVPVWNDKVMYNNGVIYTHTGDMVFSTEYVQSRNSGTEIRSRSVNWIANERGNWDTWTKQLLRLPGNDISKLKSAELQSFLKSGRCVVAEQYLYDLQQPVIDKYSVVYDFINSSKEIRYPLYSVLQADYIDKTVRATTTEAVTFTQLPAEYNGSTPDNSAAITNPNYLPTNSGRAYMSFRFNVTEAGYSYRIYVDQDKDSKFDDNEVILTGAANVGENNPVYQVGVSTVGLVQWKIEVYKTDNPDVRFVKTGCSAVSRNGNSATAKKEVNVLQIMPTEPWDEAAYNAGTTNDGRLNLETNELFIKYSKDLVDYDLKIHSVSWAEFSKCFEGNGFSYDYTVPITDGEEGGAPNPENLDQIGTLKDGSRLESYNMFVIGFGDTYGGVNLSNKDGQVDYLRYFLDMDKSILFTHDLSSLYNLPDDKNNKQIFGFTVNALMRDLMGMNRYGTVSRMADKTGDPAEVSRLITYQNQNADKYDTLQCQDENGTLMASVAAHGYTYYSLKRLGWDNTNTNINFTQVGQDGRQEYYQPWICKMPYRYMIESPQGGKLAGEGTGFNNANDITTKASKVNEGQITTYPYKISDTLTVANTHGQWYALSPEDPDVTVWYCLAGDDTAKVTGTRELNDTAGSSITYAVSPNDTMNNYYIYSKGNIFYTGVGHATIGKNVNDPQAMEVKLFINTMIAAANASYDPPIVEVNNDESVLTDVRPEHLGYSIDLIQNFDELGGSGYFSSNVTYGTDTYTVEFTPVDYNLVTTTLTCTIQIGDPAAGGTYIDEVRTASGTVVRANAAHEFNFQNHQDYTLLYPKHYLGNDDTRTITFKIKNDRVAGEGVTDLHMTLQPLFPLD